jgi:hypothetical protein
METESSLRNVVFLTKDRTMDNVKNCDSYIVISIRLSNAMHFCVILLSAGINIDVQSKEQIKL